MSAPVLSTTAWKWPADVLDYADRYELRPYLEPLLSATRRIFPTARQIRVVLERDQELRDVYAILFEVEVAGLTVSQAREAEKEWNRESLHCCSTTQVSHFSLLLELKGAWPRERHDGCDRIAPV
jgi:hypothetical protein